MPGGTDNDCPQEFRLPQPIRACWCGCICASLLSFSLAFADEAPSGTKVASTRRSHAASSVTTSTPPLQTVNVVTLGADPTGAVDSAGAFRAAMRSNRRIIVPAGKYLLNSAEAAPCCAFDPAGVLVSGLSNFEIDGDGATIIVGDKIALSSAFHFDRSRRFAVRGLSIQGNRTDLKSTQENAGLAFSSDVDFDVANIHFTGDFSGNGAAVVGDWLVDATFNNIKADAVGHCFDLAYLLRVRISDIWARGKGSEHDNAPGQTCVSVITDPPNAGQDHTGVPFRITEQVAITGVDEGNFNTGALIAAGRDYLLTSNYWHDNVGTRNARGIGVWIKHGTDSQAAVPEHGVKIVGDRFAHNSSKEGVVQTPAPVQGTSHTGPLPR